MHRKIIELNSQKFVADDISYDDLRGSDIATEVPYELLIQKLQKLQKLQCRTIYEYYLIDRIINKIKNRSENRRSIHFYILCPNNVEYKKITKYEQHINDHIRTYPVNHITFIYDTLKSLGLGLTPYIQVIDTRVELHFINTNIDPSSSDIEIAVNKNGNLQDGCCKDKDHTFINIYHTHHTQHTQHTQHLKNSL